MSGARRSGKEGQALAAKFRFPWASGTTSILYKFRSFQGPSRKWVRQILLESKIYFSHPGDFNDPFDVAPVFCLAGNPTDPALARAMRRDELRSHLGHGKTRKQIRELRRQEGVPLESLAESMIEPTRRDLRNHARILCLSENCTHPLQWSHYANGHEGLCIHFKARKGTWAGRARQVVYQALRAPIYIPLSSQSEWEMVDLMALTKADFWRYEREYRVIVPMGRPGHPITLRDNFYYFAPSDITGVTVGLRMSVADRRKLARILAERRQAVEVFECIEDRTRFALEVRPVDPRRWLSRPRNNSRRIRKG